MKKYILHILFLSFVLYSSLCFAEQNQGFKLQKYEKFNLKNGMTIYLMEQHEVPLIYVSAKFIAGAIQDGMKNGLADMTAKALMYGTKKYSKSELEEELDFVGASLEFSAGLEFAQMNASFAAKDQDKILDIIHEVLINPVFDQTEFVKAKTRCLSELKQTKEIPNRIIGNYFNKFIYKDHPYANPVSGTEASIESINVNDIKFFYEENYNSANTCLAIVGDFDSNIMRKKIKKLFEEWKKKPINEFTILKPELNFDEPGVYFINKDDAHITTFYIGGKGIKRNDEDYVALQVINTIFGGRFTSWLNDELRVNHGLTYGVRSSFSSRKLGGTFIISTFSANHTTIEAIDRTLNIVDSLHTFGIDENTLKSAKNYVKGIYPNTFETSGQLAALLTNMDFYGLDEKSINEFNKKVDELSLEKTKELIIKHFPKENFQFVLIGKYSFFEDEIQKYGKMTLKQFTDDGF